MEWVLIILSSLIAIVAGVLIIGLRLPKQHVVSRTVRLKQSPEVVWQTIADFPAYPSWRSNVQRVERLADREGDPVWLEVDKRGQGIPLQTMESVPPHRLVRRIADPKLPFGGSWRFEITPADGGSAVTITEHGEVYNPIFRFVSRFILGHTATIDSYLRTLGNKFGQNVQAET